MKTQHFLLTMLMLAGVGCAPTLQTERQFDDKGQDENIDKNAYLESLSPDDMHDGLVFWTSDEAFSRKSELLLLLDTLYRHVRTDSFPSEVKTEEKWMSEYREKLCSYYDLYRLGSETIPENAKADSVLNEGDRLMELGCSWSTMEMIVNNSASFTFDRCKEYGLLNQLIMNCESEEAKELIYKEWALYEKMLKKITLISSNIVELNYWGGSMAGPAATANYCIISGSRRHMYQTILNIVTDEPWDGTGVYLRNAEQLLFGCCDESLRKIVERTPETFFDANEEKEHKKVVKETEKAIQELKPLIEEWIVLMDQVDKEFTMDGSRHCIERAGALMLMKWASIVSDNP